MAIERLLTGSIQNQLQELMSTEDLVIEAFRDLVKDELKTHIRAKVDEDPELKAEIKEAVAYYFHSNCLLYTSPSPRDGLLSRMPSSA